MNSVNRWHPLPPEVYALVERAPASVLLEHAKPHAAESQPVPSAEPGSLLFLDPLRVCVVNQPADLPGLFAEIERSVAQGLFAAGYFTYECGNGFEPAAHMRPGRPGQPLAWFGIYRESYRFDHRTGAFIAGAPPGLAPPYAGNRTETPAPAPRSKPPSASPLSNTPSASPPSTSGSAPATFTSSTSPPRSRSVPPSAPPRSTRSSALPSRSSMAPSSTANPAATSSASRRSSSSGSKAMPLPAASPPAP